jgi:hypothetical protein
MVDGTRLTVRKDKTHHRAFDSAGKQVGEAWIKLSSLQDELKFKIVGEQGNGHDRDRCGHFKEEICGMDNTACDGQCGEHASRANELRTADPDADQKAQEPSTESPEGKIGQKQGGEPQRGEAGPEQAE